METQEQRPQTLETLSECCQHGMVGCCSVTPLDGETLESESGCYKLCPKHVMKASSNASLWQKVLKNCCRQCTEIWARTAQESPKAEMFLILSYTTKHQLIMRVHTKRCLIGLFCFLCDDRRSLLETSHLAYAVAQPIAQRLQI